jgi:N-acetylneuraminic acid mutarotase
MILWGGQPVGSHELASSGGCYDPLTDSWRPTAPVNAPRGRLNHTAVWTGTEMIVWGGYDTDGKSLTSGGRYNPRTDTWIPTTTTGVPGARASHAAVWTGREMLVWGGYVLKCSSMWDCDNEYPSSYGRYDPVADQWTTRPALAGAPSLRAACSAFWDGRQMVVWGGYYGSSYGRRTPLQSGGRFDPATETWLPTSLALAPSARDEHAAIWTGTELLVWGGVPDDRTGGHYRPATDSWIPGTTANVPRNIVAGKAVWTGEAMLVFTDRLYEYFQAGPYAHDGLPDDWQRRHFGEANLDATPDADPDDDQQNNGFEYLSGTDPRDNRSRLKIWCEPLAAPSPGFRIGFSPVVDGRTYSLWHSAFLATAPFERVDNAEPERAGETSWFTLPESDAPCGFFRLEISLP